MIPKLIIEGGYRKGIRELLNLQADTGEQDCPPCHCGQKMGYQLNAGQFKVKPFVVSLSNHERLSFANAPPYVGSQKMVIAIDRTSANKIRAYIDYTC